MNMASFQYLIRFKDESGNIKYGEVGKPTSAESLIGSTVRVLEGINPWDPDLHLTEETAKVLEVF